MKIISILISIGLSVATAQQVQPTVVRGAPYSADEVQQQPGSTETAMIGHFFRDFEGRTREETESIVGSWYIEILDPVAGVAYVLDGTKKVAYRRHMNVKEPSMSALPSETVEDLGTQVVDGVLAHGTRRTSDLVVDSWESLELKVNLLTKSSNGYTEKLVNIRRIEPDPVLFRPPADYAIVDQ